MEILLDSSSALGEVGMLLAALGILTTVIGVFWKIIHSNHRETKNRADVVETKLETTVTEFGNVKEELGELRGRVTIAEEITPTLREIKDGVDVITKAVVKP